ncbi:MAG: selenide, water dikinase SelD [Candidatus Marinimicrobia bacterium]|nr:selenide, water dikinase SelD [Candidatus Neomarinimicrobiota bacterium]
MKVSDFDFDLPRQMIAGRPVAPRDSARLLEVGESLGDHSIRDLPGLLRPGDVLVLTKALGTGFITTAFKAGKCPDDVIATASESMAALNAAGSAAAIAVGARASTDITGFGLAGHAGEMAQASDVTIVIDLHRLPLLPGAEALARQGNKTRASVSNRGFAEPMLRIEGEPDPLRLEFAFDAQTSGGLLISVAEDRAEDLVARAKDAGAAATSVIGEVREKSDVSLVLRG